MPCDAYSSVAVSNEVNSVNMSEYASGESSLIVMLERVSTFSNPVKVLEIVNPGGASMATLVPGMTTGSTFTAVRIARKDRSAIA